ncbi:MAG: phytoene/squalene synthase family protein [Planctomycetaceae bacterium]
MSPTLAQSIDSCRWLARRTGKNFYWSFLTLPKPMRQDMCVLYAFMRNTDDIGDNPCVPVEQRVDFLKLWRGGLEAAAGGESPSAEELREAINRSEDFRSIADCDKENPAQLNHFAQLLPAVGELIRRRAIPMELFHDVINGVESDLTPHPIGTFADLEDYCYHVAGAVGLCCIHIWGFQGEVARQQAIACGTAFQLTNILRDLQEDARNGRVYLPRDVLEEYGVDRSRLADGKPDDNLRRLIQSEVQRAKGLYVSATRLLPLLSRPGQRVYAAMLDIYGGLLDEIEQRGYDVFSKRVSLSRGRKLRAAIQGWLCPGRVARSIARRYESGDLHSQRQRGG